MEISGFTFVHNALDSGYPIVEAIRAIAPYVDEVVVVDMQSTDGTRELLEKMDQNRTNAPESLTNLRGDCPLRIIDGYWGNEAGETLRQAHSQYMQCEGDVIVHFEADEVFDDSLIELIVDDIRNDMFDIAVYRLQLEQNFQRCRWYPELVHRVFPKHSNTRKDGHTTDRHNLAAIAGPQFGFLWDITNCFRDNWLNRVNKQAELRNTEPQYIMTPLHCLHNAEIEKEEYAKLKLGEAHWTWTKTPFNIPKLLEPLVGQTRYEPKL